jgi:dethiobiotin synthetase
VRPGRGVFVTGTGTEVGKSVTAAVIAATARREGGGVAVFKPAVSGLDEAGEPDHELLARASGTTQTADQISPYRFAPAVSPHLAAELEGRPIDPGVLRAAAAAATGAGEALVCEGVGGLLVPLTPDYLVRDLARELGYPLVIAAGPGLGTINHTLLTVEAARAVGLEVRAVVLTPWPANPGELELSNRATIAELGRVEVLTLAEIDLAQPGHWPHLDLLGPGGAPVADSGR